MGNANLSSQQLQIHLIRASVTVLGKNLKSKNPVKSKKESKKYLSLFDKWRDETSRTFPKTVGAVNEGTVLNKDLIS